jgi:NAD(P)-dependent dehydrogenase (short-subunit alcohol dehydrogenase family)
MITGASSGLGKAAALALARMRPRLYLVCRDRERAERTVAEIERDGGPADVRVLLADLSSQREVRRVAAEFLATGDPLHVLLNNAGAIFGLRRQVSVDGIELTFALNHLAYFTLTLALLDRLKASAPARIVNVASDGYTMAKGRFDFGDYNAESRYAPHRQYGRSKLANILFTRALARRLAGTSVTANAASPRGSVGTRFAYSTHPLSRFALRFLALVWQSADEGARASVALSSAPELAGVSGKVYFGVQEAVLTAAATNEEDEERLWDLSLRLTGLGS